MKPTPTTPPSSHAAARSSRSSAFGLAGAALLCALASSTSCKEKIVNEMHCYYNGGNAACAERYGGELPYCGTFCLDRDGNPPSPNGDGCVDWLPPDDCYSPCGDVDVTEDDSCLGGTGTSMTDTEPTTTAPTTDGPTTADSSSSDTTMPTSMTDPDTGPMGCAADDECTDPALPFCEDDACRGCGDVVDGDARCAAASSETPACGQDGSCVECTEGNDAACDGATPVCEAEQCRGCIAHEECPDTACEFATGACFPDCTFAVPGEVATIGAAIAMVPMNSACTIVLADDGVVDYTEQLTIAGGRRIALRNGGDTQIILQGNGAPTIAVSGGASLYLDRLRVSGNSAAGVSVSGNGSAAYVERCEVVDNSGGAFVLNTGGFARVRNSMVAGANSTGPGFAVTSGSAEVVDSTVVGVGVNGVAVSCGVGGSAVIRNSILFAEDDADEVACADLDASFNAAEQDLGAGQGNAAVGLSTTSFAGFATSNLLLSGSGAALVDGVAQWIAGDPLVDFQGDPRVGLDGAMEHAGADIP